MLVGYKLIEEKTGNVIAEWGGVYGATPDVPNPIRLPNGDLVAGAKIGDKFNGYRLDAWEMEAPPPPPLTKEDVDAERDKRIQNSFAFMDKFIQFRPSDRENINGAGTLAALAIMGGAKPGDYRWHGGEEDFVWITSNNSLLRLDAFQTVELGKTAASWKSKHIFAARFLKDQDQIPADYQDDKYWPEKPKDEWFPS